MSEEEKQAIEYWKTHIEILHWNTQVASEHYIKVLLDLVEKQQKEIEELKEKETMYKEFKEELKPLIKNEFIHKDKIREKIEELECEKEKYFERQVIQHEIDILKELLEEE